MNHIVAILTSTKQNDNIYMGERLIIIKRLHDKFVTLMKKILEIYWDWWHKTTLC